MSSSATPTQSILSRRRFLSGVAASAGAALAVACGSSETPTNTVTSPATVGSGAQSPTVVSAAPTTQPGGAATVSAPTKVAGQPKGELRIGVGDVNFPGSLDATKDGFSLITVGAGETLTRLTPQGKLEPWLAESVTNIDPMTWRVALRKNARFWDGTPVDADAVIAAFRKNWDTQPSASSFISKETQISVRDATTLDFATPRPAGDFPHSLVSQFFVIHKPGANGSILTGPYRPTQFMASQQMTLEPFTDHWAGLPALAKMTIRSINDTNARILALQAGDLDLLNGLPPESVKTFGADIETSVTASTRMHSLILNHQRPPFNDHAVRQATALAIDRAALNTVGLDGKGLPATGMFPPNFGVDVVAWPGTDVNRARQLLDDAGWKVGGDGVRAKDGQRLAFTLYSYPGRAELTPMSVTMQSQLKPLGYDVKIQEVQSITNQIKDGNFEAAMYSLNELTTGDPLYLFNVSVAKGGSYSYGGYTNPQLEMLVNQLRGESDPAKRQALARQGQEIVMMDVPNIYLVVPPIINAAKKGKVTNFVPHPNDLYFITATVGVA